ncbi:MAG: hypothetical protein VKJ31_04865 [Synechococcus sp.]|nr:hypothetical protein [Synechococcus sp.]
MSWSSHTVRRFRSVFCAALALLGGCSQVTPNASSQQIELSICKLENTVFTDDNQDHLLSVGDSVSYTLQVSSSADCSAPDGSLYGLERAVQRRQGRDGQALLLTQFQGTIQLPDGNLQLQSMGHIALSQQADQRFQRSGPVTMELPQLFPKLEQTSVIGQGGRFNGFVGVATIDPNKSPEIKVQLGRQS